jgi:hypothetical protein
MKEGRKFSPADIKWIKSVTRDKGKAWAYLDVKIGDVFPLNFSKNPKWYPTNYLKAKPKEIIALFQTLQATETYQGGCYVTHLVSPIDESINKENDGSSHPYTRLVTVVAINSIPAQPTAIDSKVWSFYKCNRGQICDIKTVEQRGKVDISIETRQKFIWDLFQNIDPTLFKDIPNLTKEFLEEEDYVTIEGRERTILKLHKFIERDPRVVKQAKQRAKQENRFHCEVCFFNFERRYPNLGNDFIECHHKQPISSGGVRETKIDDLAIVCANCHRMLHRKYINGNYLSVEELKEIVTEQK